MHCHPLRGQNLSIVHSYKNWKELKFMLCMHISKPLNGIDYRPISTTSIFCVYKEQCHFMMGHIFLHNTIANTIGLT